MALISIMARCCCRAHSAVFAAPPVREDMARETALTEAMLSTEQAQEILSQFAALEKKLSAAIDDEDFGACGAINAQLEIAQKAAAFLSSD
jgi:hypothetical protein